MTDSSGDHNQALDRLSLLEGNIERGFKSFLEVGASLLEIREAKLYKLLGYTNFQSYCVDRWQIKRGYANRQIRASLVIDNLKQVTIVTKILPSNESQVRPLVNLEPNQQCAVWERAVEIAGGIPTAKVVKEAKKELVEQTNLEATTNTEPIIEIGAGDICIIQGGDFSQLKPYQGYWCVIKTKREHSYDIDVFDRTIELVKGEYLIKQDYSESEQAAAIVFLARLQKIAAVETVSRAINAILEEFGASFVFPIGNRDEAILGFIEKNLGIDR